MYVCISVKDSWEGRPTLHPGTLVTLEESRAARTTFGEGWDI